MGTYENSDNQCMKCDAGCLHCNAPGQCFLCQAGMQVDLSGRCVTCSLNCTKCLNYLTCSICESGYFLAAGSSQCEAITSANIVTCGKSEYPDWTVNICIRCAVNCLDCDQITGQCLVCLNQAVDQLGSDICSRICPTTDYYETSELTEPALVDRRYNRQTIILFTPPTITTCITSLALNCSQPAYGLTLCDVCMDNFSNHLGICLAACPSGYFSYPDRTTIQYICYPCMRGCIWCNSIDNCLQCDNSFILNNNQCVNDDVRTYSTTANSGLFLVDGYYVTVCPPTTILIGAKCIPMSTCRRISYQIDVKQVICSECMNSSEVAVGMPSPPSLTVVWNGKCYSTCPTGPAGCIKHCSYPTNRFSLYSNSQLVSCDTTAQCVSPIIDNICDDTPLCTGGTYLDEQAVSIAIIALDISFCKPCPAGCDACMLIGKSLVCTICSVGYETYEFFSMQNPTTYNTQVLTEIYVKQYFCLLPSLTPCTALQGYASHLTITNYCVICTAVNGVECTGCPSRSYFDKPTFKCVAFCGSGRVDYAPEKFCYNSPQLAISVNFPGYTYTHNAITYNIANTSFTITAKITASFLIQVTYGYCIISPLTGITIYIPNSALLLTGTTVIFTIPYNSTSFDDLLSQNTFNVYCYLTVRVDSRLVMSLSGYSGTITQISRPIGSSSVTPTTGNVQTIFTMPLSNWRMDLIKSIWETTLFKYEIYIVATNSINRKVQTTQFLLKTITPDNSPSLYPTDGVSLTQMSVTVVSNLVNSVFNKASLLLKVYPLVSQFAHLITQVSYSLTYSFTKPSVPKNSQYIIITRILETQVVDSSGVIDKNAMKAIADETLLSRGVLPYDIEQTADLSNKKLSNVLSKIGFSLTCDNILNCSGVGTCKSLNYNWYDMCICPLNYAGEQCEWPVVDLETAKSLLNSYLKTIISDLPTSNDSSTAGLSAVEIVTLLQVWTDARETFTANSYSKLEEIIDTEVLQSSSFSTRLLYILDNMFDILRKIDISEDKLTVSLNKIYSNIQSTLNMMASTLDGSENSRNLTISQSNFKGLLVHGSTFTDKPAISTVKLSLPNSVGLLVPASLVSDTQYLEIFHSPIDNTGVLLKQQDDNLFYILSNSLKVSVRDIVTGESTSDSSSILKTSPLTFNSSFVLSQEYLLAFKNISCVFWDTSSNSWSTKGVSTNFSSDSTVSCSTTHLTEFALANIDYAQTYSNINATDTLSQTISSDFQIYFVLFLTGLGLFLVALYVCAIKHYEQDEANHTVLDEAAKDSVDKQDSNEVFPRGIFPMFFADDDDSLTLSSRSLSEKKNNIERKGQIEKQGSEAPRLGFFTKNYQVAPSPQPLSHSMMSSHVLLSQNKQKQMKNQTTKKLIDNKSDKQPVINQSQSMIAGMSPIKKNTMKFPQQFALKHLDSLRVADSFSIASPRHGKLQVNTPKASNNNNMEYDLEQIKPVEDIKDLKQEQQMSNQIEKPAIDLEKRTPEKSEEIELKAQKKQVLAEKLTNFELTKPFTTVYCWKYSFRHIRNSERVLVFVVTIAMLLFCSSFYFEYIYLTNAKELSIISIIVQTLAILIIYELIVWFIVALIGMSRLLCCGNLKLLKGPFSNEVKNKEAENQSQKEEDQKKKGLSRTIEFCWNHLNCFVCFILFVISSASIVKLHENQTKRRFIIWAIATTASVLVNCLIEFISVYIIIRSNALSLLGFIKYKRLDF